MGTHTKASICNAALALLGKPPLVEDVEAAQQYDAADAAVRAYDQRLGRLLRSKNWNFAETLASIDAAGTAPVFGYAYKYPLPNECARVWALDPAMYGSNPDFKVRGGFIECNFSGPLKVIFIKRVTDTSLFDDDFAEALAAAIAHKIAAGVLGSLEAADYFRKEAGRELGDAKVTDSHENPQRSFDEGTLFLNRRSG